LFVSVNRLQSYKKNVTRHKKNKKSSILPYAAESVTLCRRKKSGEKKKHGFFCANLKIFANFAVRKKEPAPRHICSEQHD